MVKSEELIGTTEHLTLHMRCPINRCRYNRVRFFVCVYVFVLSLSYTVCVTCVEVSGVVHVSLLKIFVLALIQFVFLYNASYLTC
jgi:hypothetical protein